MAKVVITEKDLTSSAISVDTTDIAYIPGFGDASINLTLEDGSEVSLYHRPMLISSLAQFKKYFGSTPMTLTQSYLYAEHAENWDACSYDESDDKNKYLAVAGEPDRSYLYAVELLNADMPIYYERVNATNDNIDPADIYADLAGVSGESILDKLIDKGTYNIKYLTTGGWPIWDYIDKGEPTTVYQYTTEAEIRVTEDQELEEVKVVVGEKAYLYSDGAVQANVVRTDNSGTCYTFTIESEEIAPEDGEESIVASVFVNDSDEAEVQTLTISDPILVYDEAKLTRPIVDNVLAICMQRTENEMLTGRGDCLALIDHTNNSLRPLSADDAQSVYGRVNSYKKRLTRLGSFGAMFTPWENYTLDVVTRMQTADGSKGTIIKTIDLPGSFAYLRALSIYVRDYSKNHEAVAGPIRGRVSNAIPRLDRILTNTIADSYQTEVSLLTDNDHGTVSINAITQIYPYGQVIWGNRTLEPKDSEDGVKATHFINIRNMVSDIRKVAYRAARKYMFEQNSEILWFNFKSEIIPTLENFKTSYGITAYKIKKIAQEKTWLHVEIIIKPVYAVEEFKVNLVIQDDDIKVDETEF